MTINLNSIDGIPQDIARELRYLEAAFAQCEYSEKLLENSALHSIAETLNELCCKEGVIGYHYTRAVRGDIEASGLQVSKGADRRCAFMTKYGNRFTDEQRQLIHQAWNAYFDSQQTSLRDGRIWFNFTLGALKNTGDERLLGYFGGEVVYMPLTSHKDIAAILGSIGEPLIVECALSTDDLNTSCEIPWGRTLLSTYHVSVNPDAQQHDVDAYTTSPVSAAQLISIRHPSLRSG